MKGRELNMQMVEEGWKIKYEITTSVFSLRKHYILGM
jgi:hypothetical protein